MIDNSQLDNLFPNERESEEPDSIKDCLLRIADMYQRGDPIAMEAFQELEDILRRQIGWDMTLLRGLTELAIHVRTFGELLRKGNIELAHYQAQGIPESPILKEKEEEIIRIFLKGDDTITFKMPNGYPVKVSGHVRYLLPYLLTADKRSTKSADQLLEHLFHGHIVGEQQYTMLFHVLLELSEVLHAAGYVIRKKGNAADEKGAASFANVSFYIEEVS